MDFGNLGNGSPFYILTQSKGQKPTLEVGTVKEKALLQPQYQLQAVPGAMNGITQQQNVRLIVTIDGSDRPIPDIPANVEIAQKGDVFYTGSQQAIIQAIDQMMQVSKGEIERDAYNHMVIDAGKEMMGVVNPQYAASVQQEKIIRDLQDRQDEQGKMLKDIHSLLQEIVGSAPKSPKS